MRYKDTMKQRLIILFLLMPLIVLGQRITPEQSQQRIHQLQLLLQQYRPRHAGDFVFYPDCGFVILTDRSGWQGIVALDGTELLPSKYIIYRQIVDKYYSPYLLILSKDKMGLVNTEMQWVIPMECKHDEDFCLAGCYAPYMHHWLEDGHACLKSLKRNHLRKQRKKEGWIPVKKRQKSASLRAISGPYESLIPITDDLFQFITGNPGDRGDNIFGFVDIYGNTTATPPQLATMEKWLSGVIEYDVEPITVTSVVPAEETSSSFASLFICLSNIDTIGYLFIPNEDSASMSLFNKQVSKDLWDRPVGISPKRYSANLADVQQTEALLAELMKDDILPLFGCRRRYIGNPENYRKYSRRYGFYYNEEGERCVYVQMLLEKYIDHIRFINIWDACDTAVYLNLNLDTRKVIRAYQSSCQSY